MFREEVENRYFVRKEFKILEVIVDDGFELGVSGKRVGL